MKKTNLFLIVAGLLATAAEATPAYMLKQPAPGMASATPQAQFAVQGSPTTQFAATSPGMAATDLVVTLMNTGAVAGTYAPSALTGANSGDFSLVGNTCASSVAPNATCAVTVRFTPTSVGARTADLSLTNGTLTFTGTGMAALFKAWTWAPGVVVSADGYTATWPVNVGTGFGTGASVCEYSKAVTACGKTTGKWYVELSSVQALSSLDVMVGMGTDTSKGALVRTGGYNGATGKWAWAVAGSGVWADTAYTAQANDVVGLAYDADAGNMTFYLYQSGACQVIHTFTGWNTPGAIQRPFILRNPTPATTVSLNSGQSAFRCKPAGYGALN